jgi:thiamine-monophosphate kinase
MSIAPTGEFGLIQRVTARLGTAPTTLVGPGDDAALVSAADARVLVSCDVLVDGRHFRRDWCSATDIGHRAAAANLADIAAMGGVPTALVVSLCLPADTDPAWAEQLADGLGAECAIVGAAVVGGDLSASPVITVAVTALGDLRGRAPVLRSGARDGDIVAMAGRVGQAAAGFTVLSRGFRAPRALVDAYRRPEVPYHEGPVAADLGATAMIDVSDGLLADVGHIAEASGVAIDIDRAAFDLTQPLRDAAAALGVDPHAWVLTGGDDHPLVATFPPTVELPESWRIIGRVAGGSGVTVDGRRYTDGPPGWDHFR